MPHPQASRITFSGDLTQPFGGKTWHSISPQCMLSSSRKSPPSERCANRLIVSLRGAPKVAHTMIGRGWRLCHTMTFVCQHLRIVVPTSLISLPRIFSYQLARLSGCQFFPCSLFPSGSFSSGSRPSPKYPYISDFYHIIIKTTKYFVDSYEGLRL